MLGNGEQMQIGIGEAGGLQVRGHAFGGQRAAARRERGVGLHQFLVERAERGLIRARRGRFLRVDSAYGRSEQSGSERKACEHGWISPEDVRKLDDTANGTMARSDDGDHLRISRDRPRRMNEWPLSGIGSRSMHDREWGAKIVLPCGRDESARASAPRGLAARNRGDREWSLVTRRPAMPTAPHSDGLSPGLSAGLAVGAVFAALLVGKRASPGPDHPRTQRWYKRLEKPGFTPPTPVYPLAWTAIEASLAYGGYRLFRAEPSPERTKALVFWTLNQVGIGGWSEIFFGRRAPGWGTAASAGLGVSAVGYVLATANRTDKIAAALGVPLAGWVAFATLLSEEIWRQKRADCRELTRLRRAPSRRGFSNGWRSIQLR